MKKRQTALTAIGALIATPIIGVAATTFVSCKKAQDDSGISVSTKDVEVNHNSGVGEFDIILDEQPMDNQIYVYVITAEGPHHMELLDTDERVYHGHPAILYDCFNGVSRVRMGFTEFVGVSTKTVVSLQVRYNNRKGDWVLKNIHDINLTVTYQQNPIEEVHLFSLNDLHGVAEGYGEDKEMYPTTNVKNAGVIRIMNEIAPVIDSHPGSFLVTAGDNNSGDMFSTSVHGESIFNVLKAMGARYSAVGNHAFEWGLNPMATYQFDNWARTEDTMGTYYVASNILNGKIDDDKEWCTNPNDPAFVEDYALWQSQRVGWADPYKLVNMNGHLICLIGLTTKATIKDGNKSVVDNLSFIDYNAAVDYSIYTCKQETKDQLFNSIESFVLLTHVESSINEETKKPEGDAIDIAGKVTEPKIDAIISAHSHKNVDVAVTNGATGKKIWVGQAETEGRAYLDLTFHFDNTKPVGQKKVDVAQKVVNMGMAEKYPEATPENYQKAHNELEDIKKSPRSPIVTSVINEFNRQSIIIERALGEKIAERTDTLLYPAVRHVNIGHEYYCNDRSIITEKPDDGGYVIDQLGAWINYASIIGFSSLFAKDIEESSKGLTYPAISFINEDSMKIEFDDHPVSSVPVTLKDMYSVQTYENPIRFGYLSIWQLGNIINHALSGRGIFNYETPGVNYYDPNSASQRGTINDLSAYTYEIESGVESQKACEPKDFKSHGEYKGLNPTYCLYPCGPTQMYGCKFGVIAADGETEPYRRWKLANVPGNPEKIEKDPSYPKFFPDIQILDPLFIKDKPYSTICELDKWLTAEQYYNKYDGMIPIVTNSFLYEGANWETPMFEVYMKYNEGLDWRTYPVMMFSTITRDALIEFCKKTGMGAREYDMPISIVEKIVTYKPTPAP